MARVGVVQLVSSAQVEDNLKQVSQFMERAREEQVELVVLPENFACMGMDETSKLQIAETHGQGAIQDAIRGLAKRFGIWIVAGTIPLRAEGSKVRASCLVYDEKGNEAGRYDKIHLFDVRVSDHESHQESLITERGDELAIVSTPVGKIGLTVCYDVRFPELFRMLAVKGAQLYTVPSAFTEVTGLAHWEVLLRARAIENLAYVLAPNQGGHHVNGRNTFGHSMIIEPWGKVLAQRETGLGMITADIDLKRLTHLRHQFPCVDHHILVQ